MGKQKGIPPYVQRGLLALIVLLMGVSVARLLTRAHQQEERIEQLEEGLEALYAKLDRMEERMLSVQHDKGSSERASWQNGYPSSRRSNSKIEQGKPADNSVDDMPSDDAIAREGGVDAQSNETNNRSNDPSTQGSDSNSRGRNSHLHNSDASSTRSSKYSEPTRFNLNHIDSLSLVRIPGIAARTASIILRQRQRYGGFYDPWQLQDFLTWEGAQAYMEEWCTQWFTADVSDVHHIRINQSTVTELSRHPYITYEQAKEIVRYRTRNKKIAKLEELQNFATFTEDEVRRLAFYLSFE